MLNDNCQSSSLRVVDLDGMSKERDGGVRMLRDVVMLLGVCDMGALPLPDQLSRRCNRNAKKMANDIHHLANDAMSDKCSSLNTSLCPKHSSDEECDEAY